MSKIVATSQASDIAVTTGSDVVSQKEITVPWSELVHLAAGYTDTGFANTGEVMRHVIGTSGTVNGHSIGRYNMTYNRKREILGLGEDSADLPDFDLFCSKDPRVQNLPDLEDKVVREAGIHLVLLQYPELAQDVVNLKEQVAALRARSDAARLEQPHRKHDIALAEHRAFVTWFLTLDKTSPPVVLRSEIVEAVQAMIDRKWAARQDLMADSVLAGMKPSEIIIDNTATLYPDGNTARAGNINRQIGSIVSAATKRNST